MNDLQNKLFDILAFFHDFCAKNDLRYYIIAGTMLGAVRHKGFIPWDDDIDVAVPRPDYEKLRGLIHTVDTGKYRFEFPEDAGVKYPALNAKLYDTETTFTEKKRVPVKKGVYIDIFPLDGVGRDLEKAKEEYKHFYKYLGLYTAISAPFLKRYGLLKNIGVLAGRIISPLFVNAKKLMKKIDLICQKYDFDSSDFVCILMGGEGPETIVPKECFGTPALTEFESIEVCGLERPDLYLKALYGDYMKLPPEDKRFSHHVREYCDLNNSYLKDSTKHGGENHD